MRRQRIPIEEWELEAVIVRTEEDRPWVIMVPSQGRGAADFEALQRALDAAGWNSAAIDPRGVGDSTLPLDGATLQDLGEDLSEVISHFSAAPAAVIGHAFGSRVARWLAADQYELFRCAVLLAPEGRVPATDAAREALDQLHEDLSDEDRRAARKAAFFAEGSDPDAWRDGWHPAAAAAQARLVEETPLDDYWTGGEFVPLLVIQGCEDRVAPPENGHLLAKELGDRVTLLDLEGAGHALLPEQPERIAEAVIDFLKPYYDME